MPLDNADGQLARLTKQGSRTGRALDGLADHLVFVSIYAHLCLRYTAGGAHTSSGYVALAAGMSHSLQSAAADYFRNAWLYFAEGKSRAELDSSRYRAVGVRSPSLARPHPGKNFCSGFISTTRDNRNGWRRA